MARDPSRTIAGRAFDDASPDSGLSRSVQAREAETANPHAVSATWPSAWERDGAGSDERLGAWF